MFSPYARYTAPEWELVDRWLDRVYDDFTAKAAQGRGLTREQVHEVARGRVWTGAQARERGLVDELGGLHHALALARDRVGLPEDAPVLDMPETSPIERLRPARSSDDLAAAGLGGGLRHPLGDALGQAAEHLGAEAWGPLRAIAAQLGLPTGGPLLLPVTPLLI